MHRYLTVLACLSLFASVAEAEPAQLMYLHAHQTIEFSYRATLDCICMNEKEEAPSPENPNHRYTVFWGEAIVTAIGRGVVGKPKRLEDAVHDKELEVVGINGRLIHSLYVKARKPRPDLCWRLEVKQPTMAIPIEHGLTDDELRHRRTRFADFSSALGKLDLFRAALRDQFPRSRLPLVAYDKRLQEDLFWSGPGNEFPWDGKPAMLTHLPSKILWEDFLLTKNPYLSFLQASFMAGEPLTEHQVRLFEQQVGNDCILKPSKVPQETQRYIRGLAELPAARSFKGVFGLLHATYNVDLTDSSAFQKVYEQTGREYHQQEIASAKRDMSANDIVCHLYDGGGAFLSQRDKDPTRIAIPMLTADAVATLKRDFKRGGVDIITASQDWLEAATRGERPGGKPLCPGDAGCYFQILGAILKHLPPAIKGQKMNGSSGFRVGDFWPRRSRIPLIS